MKKFLSISLSTLLISTSLFGVNASAAHQHSWKYTDGAYSPPSYGSHQFNHKHSDGATYVEHCTTITNRSRYERVCTICDSKESGENHSISHSNSHCPNY